MTKQEIKGLLKRHAFVEEEIRNCVETMQCQVDDVKYERDIKACISDGMPHTKNGYADPTFKKAEKILDDFKVEIDRLEKRQEGLFERKARVEGMLAILSPVEKQIIELRYFRKYKWCMVTSKMNYCKRSCQRYQNSAIAKIEAWVD